jgi:hypothetical protein
MELPVVQLARQARAWLEALGSPLPSLDEAHARFSHEDNGFSLWLSTEAWTRGLRPERERQASAPQARRSLTQSGLRAAIAAMPPCESVQKMAHTLGFSNARLYARMRNDKALAELVRTKICKPTKSVSTIDATAPSASNSDAPTIASTT